MNVFPFVRESPPLGGVYLFYEFVYPVSSVGLAIGAALQIPPLAGHWIDVGDARPPTRFLAFSPGLSFDY